MQTATEGKIMTPESFQAHYAPRSFDMTDVNAITYRQKLNDSLPEDVLKLVDASRRYGGIESDFDISVRIYGSDINSINTQERAANAADEMERYMERLQDAMRKVAALKLYYEHAAQLLSCTEKVPAYILSRNKRDNSTPVTYTIAKGYYDKTICKLVIESWKVGEFTGKQHREARSKFEQLVKAMPRCVGYEVNNHYHDHVKFDEYTITA